MDIGVILSSTVAIISVLVTGAVSWYSVYQPAKMEEARAKREDEWRKREKTEAEDAAIDQTALTLLEYLSYFRHENADDVQRALPKKVMPQRTDIPVYQEGISTLQGLYYRWESVVWPRLGSNTKEKVKDLRSVFEANHYVYPSQGRRDANERAVAKNTLAPEVSKLSDSILSITRSITDRS